MIWNPSSELNTRERDDHHLRPADHTVVVEDLWWEALEAKVLGFGKPRHELLKVLRRVFLLLVVLFLLGGVLLLLYGQQRELGLGGRGGDGRGRAVGVGVGVVGVGVVGGAAVIIPPMRLRMRMRMRMRQGGWRKHACLGSKVGLRLREVEACAVAVERPGRGVVSPGGLERGGEGAEPEAGPTVGLADLGDPLSPGALPDAAEGALLVLRAALALHAPLARPPQRAALLARSSLALLVVVVIARLLLLLLLMEEVLLHRHLHLIQLIQLLIACSLSLYMSSSS